MSGLFTAMAIVKATFDKYAGKDGDKTTLTKAELSDLLKAEFFEGKTPSKAEVDEFFKSLDVDSDGVVDYTEYVTFVAALTVICNKK
ncbi:ictacalcin-like [Micropterus salmoides]|uniref:ictacalcin-like n=1 Tax=Micropterus salmoides TaxID=27706 RepID=UPI0018EC159B|nr:ictacalcin-like [Micropterus salmoides]